MNLFKRNFFVAGVAFAACVSGTAFGMSALKEISLTKTKACFYQGTNGATLPYRLLSPDVKPGKKYPLVILFHGAGSRGTNNVAQVRFTPLFRLTYDKGADGVWRQGEREAFMLFPQCAENTQWVLHPWHAVKSSPYTKKPSPGLENVHELVTKLKSELPIDASRLYVTGISMGGYATWDYIVRWPDEVAAAIVVCGGADDAGIAADPRVSKIAMRIYHGSIDTTVPTVRGRSAFDAIRKTNRKATYIEFGGEGHGIWDRVYNEPGLGKWLFSNRRK